MSLSDRMKAYEQSWKQTLPPRLPIIIRVDGRAFHTFTRKCDKPFDQALTYAMDLTAQGLAHDCAGCILAYTQSDEINLLLQQDATLQTQPHFGGVVQKIVSTCASEATVHFNIHYPGVEKAEWGAAIHARFDARTYVLPWDEVPNYFLWRFRDWQRNSLNMLARTHFSHKALHKQNAADVRLMLSTKDVYWEDCEPRDKFGFWYSPVSEPKILNNGDVSFDTLRITINSLREKQDV